MFDDLNDVASVHILLLMAVDSDRYTLPLGHSREHVDGSLQVVVVVATQLELFDKLCINESIYVIEMTKDTHAIDTEEAFGRILANLLAEEP